MLKSDLEFLEKREFEICCLVRGEYGNREYGYLLSYDWNVHLGNVRAGEYLGSIQYSSPEALLADGWVID